MACNHLSKQPGLPVAPFGPAWPNENEPKKGQAPFYVGGTVRPASFYFARVSSAEHRRQSICQKYDVKSLGALGLSNE